MRKYRWHQFSLRHAFLLLTVLIVVCASIKQHADFRTARTRFYYAIRDNNVFEVQRLLRVYPSLIPPRSPMLNVGSDLSIYSSGDTPVLVAVNFESRDVFTYLMSTQPDVNGGSYFGPPIITAALTEDIYYLLTLTLFEPMVFRSLRRTRAGSRASCLSSICC